MAFLDSARAGPAARTCVVTDVPGIEYGTLPHRIQHTLLRLLPVAIQRRLLVILPQPPGMTCLAGLQFHLRTGPPLSHASRLGLHGSILQCPRKYMRHAGGGKVRVQFSRDRHASGSGHSHTNNPGRCICPCTANWWCSTSRPASCQPHREHRRQQAKCRQAHQGGLPEEPNNERAR